MITRPGNLRTAPFARRLALLSVISIVLLLVIPRQCGAFGDVGHRKIVEHAMKLLNGFKISSNTTVSEDIKKKACTFPDHRIEAGKDTIGILPANVLPAIDHYYDPNLKSKNWVTVNWAAAAHSGVFTVGMLNAGKPPTLSVLDFNGKNISKLPLKINAKVTLYFDDPAIGFNGITSMMRCIYGDSRNDKNGLSICPPMGFLKLAEKLRKSPGEKRAEILKCAWVQLGSALHYAQDLHSPGHTAWTSVMDLKKWPKIAGWTGILPESEWELVWHTTYDNAGDDYFVNKVSYSDLKNLIPHVILPFRGTTVRPNEIADLAFAESGHEVWTHPLAKAMKKVARQSRDIWDARPKGKMEDLEFLLRKMKRLNHDRLHKHYLQSIANTAGVIDCVFSMEAPTDGSYDRDATNYLGIATSGDKALVAADKLSGTNCSLGGIDQDDYYPIKNSTYGSITVTFPGGKGDAVVEILSKSGLPTPKVPVESSASSVTLNLGIGPSPRFILRVSSPNGRSFNYNVTFGPRIEPPSEETGLLDVVLLFDKSGSMKDDIDEAKKQVDAILDEITATAREEDISLRVGLVTFCYTRQGQVLRATPLTENVSVIRSAIMAIGTEDLGGDEDLHAALMYAMNKPVQGKQIEMGWRAGAAKVAFPITDEPAKEDNFTRARVADVAEKLDPVHIYPLLLPKSGSTFLSPAVRSMRALAAATDGQLVQVGSAGELPRAIVDSLKLAIRRHREEIWRTKNPPYLLYSMLGGICGLILFALVFFVITQFRKRHGEGVLLVGYRRGILDGDLTGETSARRRSPPADNSSTELHDPGRQR